MKANYLIRNEGAFKALALPERQRRVIYRQTMRLHSKIGLRTFAVVIRKREMHEHKPELNCRDVAWDYMLQRLRNQSELKPLGPTTILLVHDEGEQATIRGLARKARRAGTVGSKLGTGQLKAPFSRLIDDPVPRDSLATPTSSNLRTWQPTRRFAGSTRLRRGLSRSFRNRHGMS